MCWTTRNEAVKKIAQRDIPVFKIVRKICTDNETVIKARSYFQGYEYTLGKQVESEMIIETKRFSSSPRIYTGLHSYNIKLKKLISHVDGVTYIYGFRGFQSYLTYESAIMHCVIPKGSEYYENENGEIVSNKLRTVSIEEI